jgi:hypothetical protein
MHLIDQVQNDRHAFLVHAEIVAQISDELRARKVHFRERQLGIRLRGDDPSGRDPGFQRAMLEARPQQELLS